MEILSEIPYYYYYILLFRADKIAKYWKNAKMQLKQLSAFSAHCRKPTNEVR